MKGYAVVIRTDTEEEARAIAAHSFFVGMTTQVVEIIKD